MAVTRDEIAAQFRLEYGRCVATLVRFLGDIDLAEEAVQDAFTVAVERWPRSGLPPNPGAWITTTARNRGIDQLRRESSRQDRHVQAAALYGPADTPGESGPVSDDRLRLIFTCCHPALARTAQVALTLRLLGGLETPQIARSFLVPEPTMAQRIVRAKKKIKAAGIPYRVPGDAELPDRLPGVLSVIYLIFTEGHTATDADGLLRVSLCEEAIRLARVLAELMPDEPEVLGLLALLLLTHARSAARTAPGQPLILLPDQDRSRWDRALIAEGHELVRRCLRRNRPGPYQIQAAIAAVHADAATADQTDWRQILALYDQLLAVLPTPVVGLNRAVALAELAGPTAGLAAADSLYGSLHAYAPFHYVRAGLLRRLRRDAEAALAYDEALALTRNDAERAFLLSQRNALPSPR